MQLIAKAVDSQTYPTVEESGSQEQYHIRSTWHSEECNWEGNGQSDMRYELLNIQEFM